MSIDYTAYAENDFDGIDHEVEDFTDPIEDVVEEESFIGVDAFTPKMAVVANAPRVYLRREPTKDGAPITIMDEGDEVMVDGKEIDNSGNIWYSVATEKGAEGYSMADFIEIIDE